MDYGLLGGLAEGIKSGMASYGDARRQKIQEDKDAQQMALQKRAQDVSMLTSGVQDNAAGGLEFTPDVQAQKALTLQENKAKSAEFDNTGPQAQAYNSILKKFGAPETDEPLSAYQAKGLIDPMVKFADTNLKLKELAQNKELSKQSNKEKLADKLSMDFSHEIDPSRARTGEFGKTEARRNSAKRLQALFDRYPDNNIPAIQTRELATGVGNLLSGGSGSAVSQIEELVPHSLLGDANKIASWVTGNPKGLEQQKFIESLHDTTKTEANLANEQIGKYIKQKIAPYDTLKNTDPDRYNKILNAALEDYGYNADSLQNVGKPQAPQMGLIGQAGPGGLINSANAGAGQVDPEMQALLAEKKRRAQMSGGK